jgi:anti-sigma B factor antagonist
VQSFRVEAVPDGSTCKLILTGEMDLAAAPDITELGCIALDDAGIEAVVIELAAVTFMDSTAIGALIMLRNAALERGKKLALTHVPDRVQKVLTISGLTDVFGIEPYSRAE